MALAPVHRQGRKESNDNYAIGDVRLAVPEGAGIDGVAGSVTSFVRKLFQMVQGECDSVVGFVAGNFWAASFRVRAIHRTART